MNGFDAMAFGIAGMLAGVPLAAVAYAAPDAGPLRWPARWWIGCPGTPAQVAATAGSAAVATAIVGAVLPLRLGSIAFWIVAAVGVGLAIIDVRCRRLPHRMTGGMWAACAVCFVGEAVATGELGPLVRASVVAAFVLMLMLTVALALPGQLGLGDVVLSGAFAFSLGWLSAQVAVAGLLAGLVAQSVVAMVVRLRLTSDALPMGPSLLIGWLSALPLAGRWGL